MKFFVALDTAVCFPITMQTLLGLLCFSVLLTTAFSIECEVCPVAKTCTVTNETCPDKVDGCFSLQLRDKAGETLNTKGCMSKNTCQELKGEEGKTITKDKYGKLPDGAVAVTVECSTAYSSSASLLLALSGLLVMKILF